MLEDSPRMSSPMSPLDERYSVTKDCATVSFAFSGLVKC